MGKQNIATCEGGSAVLFFGLSLTMLAMFFTSVIDLGRIYAAQGRAQAASDAALLGAVTGAPESELPAEVARVQPEFERLFAANYEVGYLGTTTDDFNVNVQRADSPEGTLIYRSRFMLHVPTVLFGIFSNNYTDIPIISGTTTAITDNTVRQEIALVLDNTGSMSVFSGGAVKMDSLKQSSRDLVNILFGDREVSPYIAISVVPYDLAVNIGAGREAWVQPGTFRDRYAAYAPTGNGFVSNRSNDVSPYNGYDDISDAPPLGPETLFRTPLRWYYGPNGDFENTQLTRLRFGMNTKTDIINAINAMSPAGSTRINVGLMWGWFTLSPRWAGLFDTGQPQLPAPFSPRATKSLILMTDGVNTVFDGRTLNPVSGPVTTHSDDATTQQLCTAIKEQRITIYVVAFGTPPDVNTTLLQNCASPGPNHYWLAPTAAELRTAFREIAVDIVNQSIRLSE